MIDEYDWERLFDRYCDELTELVRPSVVVIGSGSEPIGSGLLVRHQSDTFVFTVGHVIDDCRRALGMGTLWLSFYGASRGMPLPPETLLLGKYRPDGDPYEDAGIMALDSHVASAVRAWTNGVPWVLADLSMEFAGEALSLSETRRVYFTSGIAPFSPHGQTRNAEEKTIAYNYQIICSIRHEETVCRGAMKFEKDEQWYPILKVAEDGAAVRPGGVAAPFRLSGLSGAPIWTFDRAASITPGKTAVEVRLAGFHSAHNEDAAIGVVWSQHVELLHANGLR